MKEKTIYVFETWSEESPVLIGKLYVSYIRGKASDETARGCACPEGR